MEHCYKTFISVGNAKQHFSRLLDSIPSLLEILPKPVIVQRGHTPFSSDACHVIDFIAMDAFNKYIHDAEILILHAGAGSVLHAIQANKKPILVPRKAQFNEHVNDHQVSFAQMIHNEGRSFMVQDTADLAAAIRKIQTEKTNIIKTNYQPKALTVINSVLQEIFSHKKYRDS